MRSAPHDRRAALTRLAGLCALAAGSLSACGKSGDAAAPAAAPAPAAAAPTGEAAYQLAATGHGFTRGSMMAANTVYVFFDATCPHCAELWKSSEPLLNRLKIVWMPVGLLRSTSGPLGVTILTAPDPVAAMNQNENAVLTRGAGLTVNPSPPKDVVEKVEANTEIFRKLGAESVPLILFRNAKTGNYGSHAGFVGTEQLAAMVGV